MKIALLGYGRMGKTIEQIALKRGHTIVLKIEDGSDYDIKKADVAIDFSIPTAAFKNISTCLNNNVAVVSGTTGWLKDYEKAVSLCKQQNGAFIYGSNFSLGVNIFFELNKKLAKMMKSLDQYNVSMEEIHHMQKLDEPSGTAITLAEGIIENSPNNNWVLGTSDNPKKIGIEALRQPDVPGTHSVFYDSEVDNITIKHTAHSRQGFALGAVVAAEWLHNKNGVFTMKDVLGI